MNVYVVVGFLVAFGVTAAYSAWTVLESRKVAAQVLAITSAISSTVDGSREDLREGSHE